MKIAYVSKPYLYSNLLKDGLINKGADVSCFNHFKDINSPENYDVIYVESMGGDSVYASKIGHKNLIIMTRGVGVYESRIDRIQWKNVKTLIFLQQHQLDYFKRRWGNIKIPMKLGVIPVPAPLKQFRLRSDLRVTNKVALIANITDRKGTAYIPDFLQMFPNLEIHHLGQVCLYGNPVREYVRWRLERDGTASRYFWKRHIGHGDLNNWLEDKSYIWLPSIAEGFCRALIEGHSKGLKPIIKHYAGAETIWDNKFLYDRMEEIKRIIDLPYEPKSYRDYVDNKFNQDKVAEIFLSYV